MLQRTSAVGFADSPAAATYTRRVARPTGGHEVERLLALAGGAGGAPPVRLEPHGGGPGRRRRLAARARRRRRASWPWRRARSGAPSAGRATPSSAAALDRPVVVVGGRGRRGAGGRGGRRRAGPGPQRGRRAGAPGVGRAHRAGGGAGDQRLGAAASGHGGRDAGRRRLRADGAGVRVRTAGPARPGGRAPSRSAAGRARRTGRRSVPLGHHRCMRELSVESVAAAVAAVSGVEAHACDSYWALTSVGPTSSSGAWRRTARASSRPTSEPTHAEAGAKDVLERLVGLAERAIAATRREAPGAEILGVGVGAPGPLDTKRGIVLLTPEPRLGQPAAAPDHPRPARPARPRSTTTPTAPCSASGGSAPRAARGTRSASPSAPGIGGGLILDGKLYHGASDVAGEIGHTTIDTEGRRCKCGNYGCLEAYASGPNIALRAVEEIEAGAVSRLPSLVGGDLTKITAQTVYQAAPGRRRARARGGERHRQVPRRRASATCSTCSIPRWSWCAAA